MDDRLRLEIEQNHPPTVHAMGELDYANCQLLGDMLGGLLHGDHARLDLALCKLDFVDSSGLRVLILAARDALKMGKTLNIVSLAPQLEHLLNISGFRPLFHVSPSDHVPGSTAGAQSITSEEIAFEVPRDLPSCRTARSKVCEFAASHGFDHESIDDIKLAVGEAVSNAARHGDGTCGRIRVRCLMTDNRLSITIRYTSDVFDPHGVPTPDLDESPEGGMGIYFMRLVMDSVRYEFADGDVEVTMEKRLS